MGKSAVVKALTKAVKKASSSSDDILGNASYAKNQKSVTNTSDLEGIKSKTDYTESPEYKAYHEEVANTRAGVNNNSTKSAGTKVDSVNSTKATEATVKPASKAGIGAAVGVTALAGTSLLGISALASNTTKASTEAETAGEELQEEAVDESGLVGDFTNTGETDGVYPAEESDNIISGSGGESTYTIESAGDSGGDLTETIEKFIESVSDYLPYILIGIAVLVILYSVTKKGKKTTRKTTSKKKLDVTMFGGIDSDNL